MEDARIVQLYWDRDERALPATPDKYGGYCTAIAVNILASREDAEECVNDTYWRAWNAMPPHRPAALSAFLGKITRNLSLNRYRRNTAAKRGGGAAAALGELADCVSGREEVEQEIDRRELLRAINAFLGALPARKRAVFLRRYWYFDRVSEITARFGMTENQVSLLLHRLRRRLRGYLLERGFTL